MTTATEAVKLRPRARFTADQFDAKFDAKLTRPSTGGCRLWKGATNQQGQPMFYDGRATIPGRRYAWRRYFGEIPAGVNVTVTCGEPGCLEPEHLALTDRRPFSGRRGIYGPVVDRYLQQAGKAWVLTVLVDGRLVHSEVCRSEHAGLVALLRAAQKYEDRA